MLVRFKRAGKSQTWGMRKLSYETMIRAVKEEPFPFFAAMDDIYFVSDDETDASGRVMQRPQQVIGRWEVVDTGDGLP